MKIGYLGPEGTFSHYGVQKYINGAPDYELVPYKTIQDILYAANEGQIDKGFVPFENSTEGAVTSAMDTLIFSVDLYITCELVIKVNQNIMIKPENKGKTIEKILSHPQAIAQCRKYLRDNFPNADIEPTPSTALASKIVAGSDKPWASIGLISAVDLYGLELLGHNIQDEDNNLTHFIVVEKSPKIIHSDTEKTSMVFSIQHKPGELYRVLDIFAILDIDMVKIESRPMKKRPGEYIFFVDIVSDSRKDIEFALKLVERKATYFKCFGSYSLYNY